MTRVFVTSLLLAMSSLHLHAIPVAGADVLFPGASDPIRVRLDVQVDGQPPEVVWDAFLKNWFSFFDRDDNGQLNELEIQRVLPLPVAEHRNIALELKGCDADGNGQASLAEMKAFYRTAGFAPVVISLATPIREDEALSKFLFKQIDLDQNGELARQELEQAVRLLLSFDEDEDEVLTKNELLTAVSDQQVHAQQNDPATVVDNSTDAISQATLKLAFQATPSPPEFVVPAEHKSLFEVMSAVPEQPLRVRIGQNFCTVVQEAAVKQKLIKQVRGFYLTQFKTAFGNQAAVTKSQLQQDATMRLIAEQFDVVERNGDGKLSVEELTVFLSLIEQGVASQFTVVLSSRGRSLFELLDKNHDSRLDYRELRQAASTAPASPSEGGLKSEQIPIQFDLRVEQGSPGTSFGPIAIPNRPKKPSLPPVAESAKAPRWFEDLDRNEDGTLSPNEFPAASKHFQKLDTNADGAITIDEANSPQVNLTLPPQSK